MKLNDMPAGFMMASGPIHEGLLYDVDGLTLYDWLKTQRQLPVELYPFQQLWVNSLAIHNRWGLFFDVGTGKTFTSIAMALVRMEMGWLKRTVVVVPPVLIPNWSRVIAKFPGVSQVCYVGTPKKRELLKLKADFVIVGVQIFKKDNARLFDELASDDTLVIVDEAQMLKNVASDNYKMVRNFAMDGQVGLLSGTPVSLPTDAYAYISLITPGVYKSQYQFESIHVESRDFWGRPEEFSNLDMLSRNLLLQAARVLKEDVLKDLPDITYTPIYYELEPKHLKLYQQLAEEQMVKLENGEKIDLTNVSALFQALQQIPCGAEYFSDGKVRSTIHDIIDQTLEEVGERKLVIFSHYRRTTRMLLDKLSGYNAVAVFGETKDRQAQIDRFVSDPTCKVIILQIQAASAGIDGLQDVCRDILFVEMPYRATTFRQAVARLHRDGQKEGVNCRVAIAERTLQVRLWEYVQDNDDLVNTVIRGPVGIREAIGIGASYVR